MKESPHAWLEQELQALLADTLVVERAIAQRDKDILATQAKYASTIAQAEAAATRRRAAIEDFYIAKRADLEPVGQKFLQLDFGCVGMRLPANPALVPLTDKWTWPRITARVKRLWKDRYLNAARAATLNKVKMKAELSVDQLADAGMKIDDSENFYIELNRLAQRTEAA